MKNLFPGLLIVGGFLGLMSGTDNHPPKVAASPSVNINATPRAEPVTTVPAPNTTVEPSKPAVVSLEEHAAPPLAANVVATTVAELPRASAAQFTVAEQMLAESNRIRALVGKPPQVLDPRLTSAAQEWVNYLVRTGQYSHYVNGDYRQGNPRTRARKYGFPATDSIYSVSENLTVSCQTAEEAFDDWRKSPSHYETVLGDFDLAGFAMAEGGPYGNFWCAVYGNEAAAPTPKLAAAPQPVRYYAPQQAYSSCSGPGCGQSYSYGRRGIFRRR